MSRQPRNVQQYLEQSRQLESALKYSTDLRKGNVSAGWFERDFQRQQLGSTGTSLRGSTMRMDAERERRETGLRTGLEAVKLARQARLKELFDEEVLLHEAELKTLGLSLVKPRD